MGSGSSASATWDGKDATGNYVVPGSYAATLTASNCNGSCTDSESASVEVQCDLALSDLVASPAEIDPSAGGMTTINAPVTTVVPYTWTVTIAGRNFTGTGPFTEVGWDGTDSTDRIVEPGLYTAVLSVQTINGCTANETVQVKVIEGPRMCPLERNSGSTTNMATGNLSHSQELFSLKGVPLAVDVSLFYRSLDGRTGPLGVGWSHNYDIALTDNGNGTVLFREGARKRLYTYNGAGYDPPQGDSSTLVNNGDGTWIITETGGMTYNFTSEGNPPVIRLSSIRDRNGNTLNFTWTGGDLTAVTDSAGRSVKFSYDMAVTPHRLTFIADANTSIDDPASKKYEFQYESGRLKKVLYPLADAQSTERGNWEYTYTAQGSLETKRDPSGNVTRYSYYPDGRMQSAVDPEGAVDPTGHTRTFVYPTGTEIVKTSTFTEKDGNPWLVTYDTQAGIVKHETDPTGKVTDYYYYADKTLKAKTTPFYGGERLTTFFDYDAHGNLTAETDPINLSGIDPETVDTATFGTPSSPIMWARTYTYETYPYDYANSDQLTSVTDNRATPPATTTYDRYDESGLKVTSTTDPLGKVSYLKEYPDGRIRFSIDATGKSTTYDYYPDTAGNRAAGIVGLLWKVTGPDGIVTTYSLYDKNGNPLEVTVADTTGAVRATTVNQYDALNRLRVVTRTVTGLPANVTKYGYDNNGNVNSVIDAENRETRYEYNYNRQVKKVTQFKDGSPVETAYEFGAAGCPSCGGGADKLTKVIDAKQQPTAYQYDLLGRLEYETDPLGKKLRYTYYDNGLVKEKYDVSEIAEKLLVTYQYNYRGQITDKLYTDGSYEHYTYYPDGKLWTAANQHISYTYEWYANGWLKSVTDDAGRKVSYDEYDNLGQKKTVKVMAGTADERVIRYDYDSANRPWQIISNAGTFIHAYDNLGRRDTLSYPNGTLADWDFDDLGRLNAVTHKVSGGAAFLTYSYPVYDQVGNRKAAGVDGESWSYIYDDLYRLLEKVSPARPEKFDFDAVGNRTLGPGAKDTAYLHNAANQITKGRKLEYGYDNAGNQTTRTQAGVTDKSWTQTWDNENRLVKVEKEKGTERRTVTFKYDPQGRRIEKQLTVIDGITKISTWTYVYESDNIALEIYTDPSGTTEKTFYTHGPGVDEHLALERNGQFYCYHADGLGSIVSITDANHNIVQSNEYDSYGMVKPSTSFRNSYTYTGREWDKETGLYYYRARYYDPMEGRFISKDPIGFKGGINLYNYVESNPINETDPFGEKSFKDLYCEKISGVIGICADLTSIGATLTGAGAPVGIAASFVSAGNTGLSLYYCSPSKVSLANAATTAVSVLSSKFKVFNIIVTDIDAGLALAGMDLR